MSDRGDLSKIHAALEQLQHNPDRERLIKIEADMENTNKNMNGVVKAIDKLDRKIDNVNKEQKRDASSRPTWVVWSAIIGTISLAFIACFNFSSNIRAELKTDIEEVENKVTTQSVIINDYLRKKERDTNEIMIKIDGIEKKFNWDNKVDNKRPTN